MNELEKVLLKISKLRRAIGALGREENPTDEQRSELESKTDELLLLEQRREALEIEQRAEPDPADGETGDAAQGETGDAAERAFDTLVKRSSVGLIADAVLADRQTEGAEAELQQELKLRHNQVPLALLERRDVTPAPAEVNRETAAILPYVFPDGAAAFLNIPQPRVPVGERDYPALVKPAEARLPAKGGPAEETTGGFEVTSLSPSRIQASFFYAREDAARFGGMDMALRDNLRAALSEQLDNQVIADVLANGTAQDESAALVTLESAVTSLYNAVDGRYANMTSQLRILLGLATYRALGAKFRAQGSNDSALAELDALAGGLRTKSSGFAAVGNTKKQKSLIRLGSRMDAVTPIWEGVTLIPDEVTRAGTGEVVLTAVMLYATSVIRAEAFKVVEYQVAA